jgi:hypothetical protein
MQFCLIEADELAETGLGFQQRGSAWPDAVAQEHWTRSSLVKWGLLQADRAEP